ncbi:MAG: hypothetical protein L6R28_11675 [Planctomycetes bacterium]|nr:hypothetical protein [Planctomycetota bacterium]
MPKPVPDPSLEADEVDAPPLPSFEFDLAETYRRTGAAQDAGARGAFDAFVPTRIPETIRPGTKEYRLPPPAFANGDALQPDEPLPAIFVKKPPPPEVLFPRPRPESYLPPSDTERNAALAKAEKNGKRGKNEKRGKREKTPELPAPPPAPPVEAPETAEATETTDHEAARETRTAAAGTPTPVGTESAPLEALPAPVAPPVPPAAPSAPVAPAAPTAPAAPANTIDAPAAGSPRDARYMAAYRLSEATRTNEAVAPESAAPPATAEGATPEPAPRTPAAALVDLGEQDYWTAGGQKPAPAAEGKPQPRPADPEFPRQFPDDGATVQPARAERQLFREVTPRAGDPELLRRWPRTDNLETDAGTRAPTMERRNGDDALLAFAPGAAPRFRMGEGLDDPGHELSAPLVLPLPEIPALDTPGGDTPGEATSKGDPAARLTVLQKLAELTAAGKKDPEEKDGKDKKGDQAQRDPEKLVAEHLREVEEKNKLLKELNAAGETTAEAPDGAGESAAKNSDGGRNARAMHLLQVLSGDRPTGLLRGHIVDARSRQPLPARVRVVDETDCAVSAQVVDQGFWCDGAFAVKALEGMVNVEVSAGRFRSAFRKAYRVEGNKATDVVIELALPEPFDFARRGWCLADLDLALLAPEGARTVWSGEAPLPADAALVARAEGVAVLGLNVASTVPDKPGEKLEPGAEAALREAIENSAAPGQLVLATFGGPEHPFCGSALGLGMTSWQDLPRKLNDPHQPLRDWFGELRQHGGLALYTELSGRRTVDPREAIIPVLPRLVEDGFYAKDDAHARLYAPTELLFDTIAGASYEGLVYDGSEIAEAIWFNLLNQGYAVPAVGAGGGTLEQGRVPFGQTLLAIDGTPTRENVLDAIRRGRCSITFGPAVFAKIFERDRGPGDRLPADGRKLSLQIQAYASMTPGARLERIEVIRNGAVVYTDRPAEGMTQLHDFRYPVAETHDAWYIVRITESIGPSETDRSQRIALTNPIYFDAPGRVGPRPAQTRMRGTLRRPGGTPMAGTVTVLEPGKPKREVVIGANGRYEVTYASAGILIFAAKGYEPAMRKIFDHPRVQRALGELHTEREASLKEHFAKPTIFGSWRLLLAELEADVELRPARPAQP